MKIQPLEATPTTFQPYGKVFTIPKTKPTAETPEYKFWSDVVNFSIKGDTEIGWCTVYRRSKVNEVERHMMTPEILIPVDAPFYVPVLKDGDADDQLKVFRVNAGEAIVIGDGIWHGACLPVGTKQSSYFVIFRRGTPHQDVAKKKISIVEIGS